MGDTELQPYYKVREHLSTWLNGSCLAFQDRAVIPQQLRRNLLESAHTGHPGIVRTKQQLREFAWWPRMDADVETFVRDCGACETAEKNFKLRPAPLQPLPWPDTPWTEIAIDIVGELQAAPASSRFLLVITDRHSKWPEIFATSSITSETVCKVLRSLFARWGLCEKVLTDNGPQFGNVFTEFLRERGIQHLKTSPYRPSTNGQTERLNRTLMDSIRAAWSEGTPMQDALLQFLETYRSTRHALTGKSPAELMMGRRWRTALSILRPFKDTTTAQPDIAQRIQDSQQRTAAYTDQRRGARPPILNAGDWVRVRRPVRPGKLGTRLSAPLQITKTMGAACRLADGSTWNQQALVPTSLRPSFESRGQSGFDPLVDIQDSSGASRPPTSGQAEGQATPAPRRSNRQRRPVQRYGW